MNLDLSYYFAVLIRRFHYLIISTALATAAAIAAAFVLPAVYSASALMVLESSSIPGQLAAPTVQAEALAKLQLIENKLMTRSNLLDIANRLNVFEDVKSMKPDDVVDAMEKNTIIDLFANRGEATTMGITFQARSGKIAADVVNEYVTQVLKEDVSVRTKSAEDTVEFFEQQVKSLGAELDQMSARILDFQNKNADALPSTLSYRMSQQTTLQGKLDMAEQSIRQLQDQKEQLIALYKATGQVGSNAASQSPEAQQLAALQGQLNQALVLLAPDNPKVKLLEAQIASLETIVKSQTKQAAGSNDPNVSMYDAMTADMDNKIALASETRDQLAEQMRVLQDSIDRTPANQIALDALNRDYSNIQLQYNNAQAALSQAAAGEQIEILSKGERLSVLDAATPPNSPSKPNRLLIVIGGFVTGVMLGFGLIFLRELLNRSVRRPKDIVSAFGITPLVTIPYVWTPGETLRRRSVFVAMLLTAILGIPVVVYAVHAFVMPLDMLMAKVANKIGINL